MCSARSLHHLITIIQTTATVIQGVIPRPIIIPTITPRIIHALTHLRAVAVPRQAVVRHLAAVVFQDPREVVEINQI